VNEYTNNTNYGILFDNKNGLLICATTWINLKRTLASERGEMKNMIYLYA
jgi:hypothetical protein